MRRETALQSRLDALTEPSYAPRIEGPRHSCAPKCELGHSSVGLGRAPFFAAPPHKFLSFQAVTGGFPLLTPLKRASMVRQVFAPDEQKRAQQVGFTAGVTHPSSESSRESPTTLS